MLNLFIYRSIKGLGYVFRITPSSGKRKRTYGKLNLLVSDRSPVLGVSLHFTVDSWSLVQLETYLITRKPANICSLARLGWIGIKPRQGAGKYCSHKAWVIRQVWTLRTEAIDPIAFKEIICSLHTWKTYYSRYVNAGKYWRGELYKNRSLA